MSKYIDAEKLIAEIKRYKNKADERLKIKGRTYAEEQKDLALQNLCGNLLHFISSHQQEQDMGEVSDGYHTFNELYYYRMLYNAAFFNLLPKEWVHKSKRHHTGEECFGGGWFIVMANLPTGQVSNHYELKDWDLFKVPEKEFADEWDGHTPQEAAKRLYEYLQQEQPQVAGIGKMERLNVDILRDWSMKFAPDIRDAIEATAYHFWNLAISARKEQPEPVKGKFVFPKLLYARTLDNKTIDVSYGPQDMTAIEYVRNDFVEQEQPEGLHFTPLNRLIQKIPSKSWNDTVNNYAKKLRDCLIKEGYRKDAEVLQGYISYMNGNNVPMATMDEHEQPEVELEKEIDKFLNETGAPYVWCNDDEQKEWCNIIARHFWNKGYKARKK